MSENMDFVFQDPLEFDMNKRYLKVSTAVEEEKYELPDRPAVELLAKRQAKGKDLKTGKSLGFREYRIDMYVPLKCFNHLRKYYITKRDDGIIIIEVPNSKHAAFVSYCTKHNIRIKLL